MYPPTAIFGFVPPLTNVQLELLALPYSAGDSGSLMHRLIDELVSGRWTAFRAAVAFVRTSGNAAPFMNALQAFASIEGNTVQLTFGADLFGGSAPASDYTAVEGLVASLKHLPGVEIYLYHEPGRTFHPKVYLFSNEAAKRALAIVGSSNWSEGGLVANVEANVVMSLDFEVPGNRELYAQLRSYFDTYWKDDA